MSTVPGAADARDGRVAPEATPPTGVLDLFGRIPGHYLALSSADGEISYVTPSVRDVLGIEAGAYMATIRELMSPEDRAVAGAALRRVLSDPTDETVFEVRIRHFDGTWRTFEGLAVNALEVPGTEAIIWHMRDVTAERLAEEALIDSEARFRTMVDYSYDLFIVLDEEMRVRWTNSQLTKIMGYDQQDVIGHVVLEYVHPDDVEAAALELIEGMQGNLPDVPTVVRGRRKDGSWIWVEVVGPAVTAHEVIGGHVLCLRDITSRKTAEAELAVAEQRFRALVQNSADVVFVIDIDNTITYVSPGIEPVFGYSAEDISALDGMSFVHAEDMERLMGHLPDLLANPDLQYEEVCRVRRGDGEWRWVELTVTNHLEDPAVQGIVVNIRDITTRHQAEMALRRNEERFRALLQHSADAIVVMTADGAFEGIEPATRLFERPVDELIGQSSLAWLHPDDRESVAGELARIVETPGASTVTTSRIRAADGTWRWVEATLTNMLDNEAVGAVVANVRDISDRKAFEVELEHQATHDSLTGLPNRMLLLDRLGVALGRVQRYGGIVGVLFLDLDHFKVVNDSRGHSLGDRLLTAIAERLAATLRPGDTVARFGGDEFVMLCSDLRGLDEAIAVGERVLEVLEEVFVVDDTELFVSASIGISCSTRTHGLAGGEEARASEAEDLIREADTAMYRAKERGRRRVAVFDESLRAGTVHRLDTENALRRAVDRDEFVLHYQPIFDLATGRVRRVEALVRWQHPDRGLLLPGEFVPLAEETGLIIPVGRWVLERACAQRATWDATRDRGERFNMSVNLSGRQLGHPDLVEDLERVIRTTGIDPSTLDLEITESLLMDDVEFSHQTLARLKRLGVHIAVDDFGTGYSSLSYLRSFPVDYLKVDRSFVAGIGRHEGDEAIVAAIVRLAHTLGLLAVAEGVETAEQLEHLRTLGCDLAQGFHLAMPSPPDELDAVLSSSIFT